MLREEEDRKAFSSWTLLQIFFAKNSLLNFKYKVTYLTNFRRMAQSFYFQGQIGIGNTHWYIRNQGKSEATCVISVKKEVDNTAPTTLLLFFFFLIIIQAEREKEY